jgi:hypothetical protein
MTLYTSLLLISFFSLFLSSKVYVQASFRLQSPPVQSASLESLALFLWSTGVEHFYLSSIYEIFSSCSHWIDLRCCIIVVKALYYKPEGHGFKTRRGEFFFPICLILLAALSSGVHSASNRNQYQK